MGCCHQIKIFHHGIPDFMPKFAIFSANIGLNGSKGFASAPTALSRLFSSKPRIAQKTTINVKDQPLGSEALEVIST
jgi:hypothetical protein